MVLGRIWRSRWVSNPTDPKGQEVLSLPRYNCFDTTPYISTAVLFRKAVCHLVLLTTMQNVEV